VADANANCPQIFKQYRSEFAKNAPFQAIFSEKGTYPPPQARPPVDTCTRLLLQWSFVDLPPRPA